VDKIDALARRNYAIKNKERKEGVGSSNFSGTTIHLDIPVMAEDVPPPPPPRVILGHYVIPQDPWNCFAIVLSRTAQQM
jgi:hypothetical protein